MPVSSKVTASVIAAAVSTILFWLLGTYAHVAVPEPVQAAGVGLLTLIVGYLIPETNPAPSAIDAVHAEIQRVK